MSEEQDRLRQTRELFDRWAEAEQGALARSMEQGHLPRVMPLLEEAAKGLPEKGRFLDLGCGTGYACEWLARKFPAARVTGIDAAPAMARLSAARLAGLPNAEALERDFMDYAAGQPEGCLDFVFSMEAWYYIPELEEAPRELRRLLAPGGRALIVMEYFAEHEASRAWPEQYGFEAHRLSSADWAALFRKSGFTSVQARVMPGGATLALALKA